MTARSVAQAKHERIIALVLEGDIDRCQNTYGVAPCTATGAVGTECVNTFPSCQDKPHYVRGVVTKKFCTRGTRVPGEDIRPLIVTNAAVTPTEIVPSKGLAMRSQTQLTLIDEPCSDHLEDPYYATRPAKAGGTFWSRFLARNPNTAGRPARVRQGYVTAPFDWNTFQTQAFVIEAIRGVDASNRVVVVLSDPLKLADRNVVPTPTSGTLQGDVKAIESTGFLVSGSTTTAVLPAAASSVDGAYVGMEIYFTAGTGQGQRAVITAYVGATRTATFAALAVAPDSSTVYQVSALSFDVGAGASAQYPDPVATGKRQWVRIGDEIVEYTLKSGNVLSWPSSLYRNTWGTVRADHALGDAVQLCRAWINVRPYIVLSDMLTESGIASGYLDSVNWQTEDATWFNTAEITAIISEPEKVSDLVKDLLQDLDAMVWWAPVEQKVKLLANQPQQLDPPTALDSYAFGTNTFNVEAQEQDRITRYAVCYGLIDATANRTEARSYLSTKVYADLDAESVNEFGDVRQVVRYSRWFGKQNSVYVSAVVGRKLARLRNAPRKATTKLDPLNEVQLGQLVTLSHYKLPDFQGNPIPVKCRVVRVKDNGKDFDVTFLTTDFKRARYMVVAPAGQPDYLAASPAQRKYGYISAAGGKMSNGDDGYYIY